MRKNSAKQLLERYNTGTCTEHEQAIVQSWFLTWKDEGTVPSAQKIEIMYDEIASLLPIHQNKEASSIKLWPLIAAVIAFIAVGTVIYLYVNPALPINAVQQLTRHDVPPGKNKAFLTLANGNRIALDDAQNGTIAKETGVKITKTKTGELIYEICKECNSTNGNDKLINSIETPKGGQYQLHLPDGTKVWLNAASMLKYPVNFTAAKERNVELSGEAYFEVAEDKMHPFKVKSSAQEIKVLGTHFNISAYVDEHDTKTTLLEGSVSIDYTIGNKQNIILKPNEQAILKQNVIKIVAVDAEDAIAWKHGLFIFEADPLEEVIKKISRWYDTEIHFSDESLKTRKFSGTISRNLSLSKVLEKLELSGALKFEIHQQMITVKEK